MTVVVDARRLSAPDRELLERLVDAGRLADGEPGVRELGQRLVARGMARWQGRGGANGRADLVATPKAGTVLDAVYELEDGGDPAAPPPPKPRPPVLPTTSRLELRARVPARPAPGKRAPAPPPAPAPERVPAPGRKRTRPPAKWDHALVVEQVAALRAKGRSVLAAAREIGVPVSTVYLILGQAKVATAPPAGRRGSRGPRRSSPSGEVVKPDVGPPGGRLEPQGVDAALRAVDAVGAAPAVEPDPVRSGLGAVLERTRRRLGEVAPGGLPELPPDPEPRLSLEALRAARLEMMGSPRPVPILRLGPETLDALRLERRRLQALVAGLDLLLEGQD